MKKLIISLIIILPFVFLIALFAVTDLGTIGTAVSVTGLTITNKDEDGIFSFDIATYDNAPMYQADLGIEIKPYAASVQDYSLSVTDTDGNETDIVTVAEDGRFTLHDVGIAKLTYTSKDGNYSDSILFDITSGGALGMSPILTDGEGEICPLTQTADGYTADVVGGNYFLSCSVYPKNVDTSTLRYLSTNETAVAIDSVSGAIAVRFSGTTTISAELNGALETLSFNLALNVEKPTATTINGIEDLQLAVPIDSDTATFYLETTTAEEEGQINVLGTGITESSTRQIADNQYVITVSFDKDTSTDTIDGNLVLGARLSPISFAFADYTFNVSSVLNAVYEGADVIFTDTECRFGIRAYPANPNLNYRWEIVDYPSYNPTSKKSNCVLRLAQSGRYTVKITPYVGDKTYTPVMHTIIVTPHYTSLLFKETASSYGLSDCLAVASMSYVNDVPTLTPYALGISAKATVPLTDGFSDLQFTSSNRAVATVDTDNTIVINASGEVTVTAQWKYGALFGLSNAKVTLNAVNGVEVNTYEELTKASKDGLAIVLGADIELGEALFNEDGSAKYTDNVMREKLLAETHDLPTTADWTYYKNLGMAQPNVKYCLEFTADVHGNGHTICAKNITEMADSTGNLQPYAVFNGPLDFVATSKSGINASVKAQDNIVFLVRKDNLVIDNVTLLGCSDEYLSVGDGTLNLSYLNYCGTTLEIASNAVLQNSYVRNGRTTVRVFGRTGVVQSDAVNVATEKINVTIDNCILRNAREFILKIGTNRAERTTDFTGCTTTFAPKFTDQNGNAYPHNSPLCDEKSKDDSFINGYCLTEVTLKDSLLSDSGLFSIGMESHFAGGMLVNSNAFGAALKLDGWTDLAATSYPALLRLVGNVEIADWKPLDNIDSSTLIETNAGTSGAGSFLCLNMKEMLTCVQRSDSAYANIIHTDAQGKQYVHGGIALYGGGYNYSMVDMSEYTFDTMSKYSINLSVLTSSDDESVQQQGQMLPYAAGGESFRFIMFNSEDYPEEK